MYPHPLNRAMLDPLPQGRGKKVEIWMVESAKLIQPSKFQRIRGVK
jgi:hypothetical protein